jgi:flagellar protein FliO/FliZ
MMVAQIVGLQQIVITVVFLSFLIGLLVFLRMKGGSIKANLQKGQRIKVIEETAISPTERLRLITIDGLEFVMLSGKGIQPALMPLSSAALQIEKLPLKSAFAVDDQSSEQLETAKPVSDLAPLELTLPAFSQSKQNTESLDEGDMSPQEMNPADVAAFAAKFKGWRKK